MSLPLRFSVWSASRAPGTAGSGICFTQTTTFMGLLFVRGRGDARPGTRRSGRDCDKGGPAEVEMSRLGRMARVDVLVAGAGPAGAAAAIAAADRGLDVRRVRPGSLPAGQDVRRRPHDPGAAPARAPRPRPCGPPRGRVCRGARGVLVSPRGREINLPLPTDGEHAGVVRRAGLDAALVAAGPSARCRRPRRRRGRRPRSRGRWREGAHRHGRDDRGAPSRRRRRSLVDRAPAPPSRRAARSRHVARSAPVLRRRRRRRACGSFFFEDLLPGYAWVFPMPDGGANVGYGVLRERRRGRDLKALWPDLLARPALRAVLGERAQPDETVHAWPIPTAYTPTRLTDGPVLYVGDAAAVVDPMTGEGIAQALETGIARGRRDRGGWRQRRRCRALPARTSTVPSVATCALAMRLQRILATPRGARGDDQRCRLLRLDAPQLRPLAVRGLSARGAASRPTGGSDGVSRLRARSGRLPPPDRLTGGRMAEAKPKRRSRGNPDEVWELVGDFGGLAEWMPGMESCEVEDDVRESSRRWASRSTRSWRSATTPRARSRTRSCSRRCRSNTTRRRSPSRRGRRRTRDWASRCVPTRCSARSCRSTSSRSKQPRRSVEG